MVLGEVFHETSKAVIMVFDEDAFGFDKSLLFREFSHSTAGSAGCTK